MVIRSPAPPKNNILVTRHTARSRAQARARELLPPPAYRVSAMAEKGLAPFLKKPKIMCAPVRKLFRPQDLPRPQTVPTVVRAKVVDHGGGGREENPTSDKEEV